MRLRNVKGSRDTISDSPFVVQAPKEYKGRWHDLFLNDCPIHIEIGMGKGKFITSLAAANPDINYIGIEKYSSVLVRAIEKQTELQLPNLVFIRMDAEEINEVFDAEEISLIYLNFSDPWPKDRHAKRRLTSRQFLARYDLFLRKDGKICFKTDNESLFAFSLEETAHSAFQPTDVTEDLHHSPYHAENVTTEYEEKFSAKGHPIFRFVLTR